MENPSSGEPPSSTVLRREASRATASLLRWARSHAKKHSKPPSSSSLHLILTLLHPVVGTSRRRRHLISLPHPLPSTSVCVVFDDRPKSPIKGTILSESLPFSKLVPFTTLKGRKSALHELLRSHALLFVDSRVVHMVTNLIGDGRRKRKGEVFAIDLRVRSRWKEQIESKCGGTTACLKGESVCCDVVVGKLSMAEDQIVDNVVTVIGAAVDKVVGGWENVRRLCLKTDESIALPLLYREDAVTLGDGEKREEEEKFDVKEGKKKCKVKEDIKDVKVDHKEAKKIAR